MPSSFNTALAAFIIGILSTVAVAQPLPVHEYRLDGNALDSAGVAHGVVGNQLPFISYGVPQALGQAIRFTTDGTPPNRTVIVPKESVTDINDNDFAFAFYVRQQQINDGDVRAIADTYGNPSVPNPIGWSIYFSASGSLHIRFRDNTGFSRIIKTNTQIVDTDWHYVVFSCDRGDVLGAKWYIDGTLDSEEIPITWWALFTMEQDLRLGSMEYFSNQIGLDGDLALFQIYHDALTQNDVDLIDDPDQDGVGLIDDLCGMFDDSFDADGDTVPDGCDVCPGQDDLLDIDLDDTPDGCDTCVGLTVDSDGDGICDEFDACDGDDALCSLPPNVLCVWPLAPGVQDGSNWYNAYRHVQEALQVAQPGTEIWIAVGTYMPDGAFQTPTSEMIFGTGDRNATFDVPSGVSLYGGFVGFESTRDQRDATANITTLSGDINGNLLDRDHSRVVVTVAPADNAPVVFNGLTIVGSPTLDDYILIQEVGISVRGGTVSFEACRILDHHGYAFVAADATIDFNQCDFLNNRAFFLIDMSDCDATFNECDIIGNVCYSTVVWTEDCDLSLLNCRLIGNQGNVVNLLRVFGGDTVLTNCIVDGNQSQVPTLFLTNGSFGCLFNCTIVNNKHLSGPSAAVSLTNQDQEVANCIIRGNMDHDGLVEVQIISGSGAPLTLNHCNVENGWSGPGVGNIDADAMFVDADGIDNIPGTIDDDLRVQAGSPVIDAGSNALVPFDITTDIAGTPRFVHCIVDMGAYEFADAPQPDSNEDGFPDDCDPCPGILVGDMNGDTVVTIDDVSAFVATLLDPLAATADEICAADVNNDGNTDGRDVSSFVALVIGN